MQQRAQTASPLRALELRARARYRLARYKTSVIAVALAEIRRAGRAVEG